MGLKVQHLQLLQELQVLDGVVAQDQLAQPIKVLDVLESEIRTGSDL